MNCVPRKEDTISAFFSQKGYRVCISVAQVTGEKISIGTTEPRKNRIKYLACQGPASRARAGPPSKRQFIYIGKFIGQIVMTAHEDETVGLTKP